MIQNGQIKNVKRDNILGKIKFINTLFGIVM